MLNDEDYQSLRAHAKGKNIVSQYGFDIKHKKDLPELENIVQNISKISKHVVKQQVKSQA